uniref:Putative odorant binding protein 29 n=1 Tax=Conopomorpha sinensis TaxID=940481 RepID=A0A649ZVA1_9NEOP|nr:putative odorant binding protein 29 [Conopomorpha sinensis]
MEVTMRGKVLYYVCVIAFISCCGAETPPFITKCAVDDAKCAKAAARAAIPVMAAGVPEYDLDPLDPMFFETMDSSSPTLKLIMKNVTMTGLKGCRALKIIRNAANTNMLVQTSCDITMKGQYEMSGQLLFVPMEGKGKCLIKLRKITISNNLQLGDMIDENGVRHWDIKSYKHSYELKDKSDLKLENLFNGNEVLARVSNQLIANSGNEIIKEVGTPIVEQVVANLLKNVNKMFHKIPAEDLEL